MVCGAWARLRRASSGGPRWSGWSSGRRSGGCTSCAGCRSGRSIAGRGCIATRSGGRSRAMSRRSIGARRRGRSSIRSRTRSTGCCARIRSCRGQRVRELIEPLGCDGGKTIVDDYLREVRPLFAPPPRTFQRTVYRPGEICQFDLWEPRARDPGRARPDAPRLGRRRVPGLLARGRRRADLLQADPGPAGRDRGAVCGRWAALPQTLVWDRQAGHPRPRRPPDGGVRRVLRRSCGSAGTSASRADPQAKGVVERLQGYVETQLRARPRASPTSSTSSTSSTPGSTTRQRAHAQDAALPADRPARSRSAR